MLFEIEYGTLMISFQDGCEPVLAGAAFFVVAALEVEAFFAAGAFLVEAFALVAVAEAGFAVDMLMKWG